VTFPDWPVGSPILDGAYVSERNLARNTQRSYRDTLQLLLPEVARRARKGIDRLEVIDVSADRVRHF